MGIRLWAAGHGAGRTMGSFSTPTSGPFIGTISRAGCARSSMSTVGPLKGPSPGSLFFNSSSIGLLSNRWGIRSLQNRAPLHHITPVIQELHRRKVFCFGSDCRNCGRLGRQRWGSWGCLCSGCSGFDGFNSDKRLLLDIPSLSWLSSAFVGEAIVMVHARHFRGDGGSSRSGFTAGLDWGQRPGLYLDNLWWAWLDSLSGLTLPQQGHRDQGSPHLMGWSGWRSQSWRKSESQLQPRFSSVLQRESLITVHFFFFF